MTTGRINQVRTIGGARAPVGPQRAGPNARAPTRARAPPGPASRRAPSRFIGGHAASARARRLRTPRRVSPRLGGARLGLGRGPSCPCGVAPAGARSPAPGLRCPQPRPGPGGFRRLGASPRASEERASGRAGGRAAHAGWPPRALARQPPACPALSLGPVQAASDARARLPAPWRSVPQAGPGAELPMRGGPRGRLLASPRPAPPSASARSRRLQTPGRVSPRLGGARLGPGWGPSCPCGVAPSGARSPAPACAVLAWPDRVPASFWFTRSERRRLHASSRGMPLGTVRLRTATRTKACDPSATASALPLGWPPPRKDTSMLRGGHRSPHAPGPSRRDGAPAPGYGRPTAGRRPGLGSVGVRSWRPGRRQRPCHRALCVLTRRGCPILYVPAQYAPAKTEALPFSGGEERQARRPAGRAQGRDWARHTCEREGRRNAPEPLIPIQAVII